LELFISCSPCYCFLARFRGSRMLTTPTVLVLGAGAHQPFNFPVGVQLSQLITDELQNPNLQASFLLKTMGGFETTEISAFRDAFYYSGKNSVDAFLEHRADFLRIGKAATAIALTRFEQAWQLFRYHPQNWLRYLYNKLNTTFEEFGANRLSIITFNYDRSVEHFFFTSLQNTYNKPDEECRTALSTIPIIHLHGRLGPLPWQSESISIVPYTSEMTRDRLLIGIDAIKIIHEDIADGRDADFERAKGLMQDAQRILFLGFGYDPTNMKRLDLANLDPNKALGTVLGLGEAETKAVLQGSDNKIRLVNIDCIGIIREFVPW
jgi:hypothetical protein